MTSRSDDNVLYQASNVVEKRVPAAASGEDGYILVADGSTGDGVWTVNTEVLVALLTTRGDLLTVNSTPTPIRLAIGAANTVLTTDGTDPSWTTIATAMVADNAITGAKIAMGSDAQGDVLYYGGTDYERLGAGTSGEFLKTQGAAANPTWALASGFAALRTYTAGTTWTKPTNIVRVVVECWGGGGGGDETSSGGGGGGGGGAYSMTVVEAGSLGSTETVTVGAGGNGTSSPTAGGDTSFGTHCVAKGGGAASGTTGGTGGAAGSGTGDLTLSGSDGGNGIAANNAGNAGGSSPFGGAGGALGEASANGKIGCAPGGGGGGAENGTSAAGATGLVKVWEFA